MARGQAPNPEKPTSADEFVKRGIAWAGKGKLEKAIADFTEAIRLNPKDAVAFYNRGLAWHKKNEHDKAIVDYTEAVRFDPKNVWAFNNSTAEGKVANSPIDCYREGS